MMKIGILLSGCGVYDGSEIQETVLTMLAIEEIGAEYVCIGVDSDQFHTVNHLTGEEMPEKRNMLVEAARIARGNILNIKDVQPVDIDALVIPGGFGNAKNLTKWAFSGSEGSILPEVKLLLVNLVNVGKPIVALCVSPVVLAKALEGSSIQAKMTLGTSAENSPYDIPSFISEISKVGVKYSEKTIREIEIDEVNRIITAPCYMMEASILEVRKNIQSAMEALKEML
jgi:enhancing lycopene biosynthesis protein 2